MPPKQKHPSRENTPSLKKSPSNQKKPNTQIEPTSAIKSESSPLIKPPLTENEPQNEIKVRKMSLKMR